jgi:hypothetical protein
MSMVQRLAACAFVLTAQPAAFGLSPEYWGAPHVVVYAALAVLVAGFRRELPTLLEGRPASARPSDAKQSDIVLLTALRELKVDPDVVAAAVDRERGRSSPSPLERRPPPVVH